MEIAEKIRRMMEKQKLTHLALANKIGVHPSTIANYVYSKRSPDPGMCLLLAAVCETDEDREYFIESSKLDDVQLALISDAISRHRPITEPIHKKQANR